VIAVRVPALPKLLPGLGVQAGGAVGPEVHVDAPFLDNRRGRCVGVESPVCLLRARHVKHLDVVNDVTAIEVNADREQFRSVLASGRQPDLVASDRRRGPPLVVNPCLPTHILRFTKFDRKILCQALAVPIGTAKLIPVALFLH